MQYIAFISYSHVLDSHIAPALQSALERIGKPWYVRRSMRVFRDTTNLSATPALWPKIEDALAQSEYLLLLASPKAAQSRWVAKELAYWFEHRPRKNLLIILTDGVIAWDNVANDFDWKCTTALPEVLRGRFSDEPLYANFTGFRGTKLTLSNETFGDQVATVASALLGVSKDEVYAEDLRQYKRTMRLYRAGIAALSTLTLIALATAGWAVNETIAERKQKEKAENNEKIAIKASELAQEREADSLKTSREAMTTAGVTALEGGRATEALHYFAKEVFFAERKPEDYWGTKNREDLDQIRSNLPCLAAAGKPSDEFLKIVSPDRYRLGAAAEKAVGLVRIAHNEMLESEPSFFGKDKTRSLSSLRFLRWNSASQERIRRLKESEIWKWPAARFEDGREVLLNGKIALITPTSKEVFARPDEYLSERERGTKPDEAKRSVNPEGMTKKEIRLEGDAEFYSAAAFDLEGKRVVTGSLDKTVRIWDASNGRELAKLEGHKGGVTNLTFLRDGKTLVTCSNDQTARLWDTTTQAYLELTGHSGPVYSAVASDDGKRLITASSDRTAMIWEVKTGKAEIVLRGHDEEVIYACFNHDGRRALTISLDGVVRIWGTRAWGSRSPDAKSIPEGELSAELVGSQFGVFTAEFSSDDRYIFASSWDGVTRTWEASFREPISFPPVNGPEHKGSKSGLASFDESGTQVITAATQQPIQVWNLRDPVQGPQAPRPFGPADRLSQFARISPDGKVVAALNTGTLSFWDRQSGAPLRPNTRVPIGGTEHFAFSPDGQWIAIHALQRVRLINIRDGRTAETYEQGGSILSVEFSPDGSRLVTGSDDRVARILPNPARTDQTSGKSQEALTFRGHTGAVTAAAFDAKGTRIVTASRDRTARVWSAETRKTLILRGHEEQVKDAHFSPDGTLVVTASQDGTVRVWDAADGQLVTVFRQGGIVETAVFRPNSPSPWILSASMDGRVMLWPLKAAEGDHELFAPWVEVFTGTTLDSGQLRGLEAQEWEERRMCLLRYHESVPPAPGLRVR